jgi:cell division protein FtsQ
MDPSPNFTARVLVFSGNISDKSDTLTVAKILSNDTLRKQRSLDEIYRLAKAINEDAFLRAQIGQVHRDVWGDFILIPLIGNQTIMFGAANSDQAVREKLDKLKTFYFEGLPYEGWNRYESINLKYRNQIVCKKRAVELAPSPSNP